MATRVFVTGGAGFIGRWLCRALTAAGHEVRVYDVLLPQVHGSDPDEALRRAQEAVGVGVGVVVGDVRDAAMLGMALGNFRPHVVVHLAAEVGVGQAEYEIERYVDANVHGTAVLLEAILRANDTVEKDEDGIRRLVVAGSMSAYGEGLYDCPTHGPVRPFRTAERLADGLWEVHCQLPGETRESPCPTAPEVHAIPMTEAFSLRPSGVYAATKRDQEEYALLVGRARSLSVAVARLFNVYGPGQALRNPYTGVAATFAARCLAGLPPRVYEDGLQVRDLVHVRDAAAALVALVGDSNPRLAVREWADPRRQGPFNVCTGEPTTVLRIAQLALEVLGPVDAVPEVTGLCRVGDIRSCLGSHERLNKATGWLPTISAEDGLRALLAEWRDTEAAPQVDLDAAHRELEDRSLVVEPARPDAPETPPEGWAEAGQVGTR